MNRSPLAVILLLFYHIAQTQSSEILQIRQYRLNNEKVILSEFLSFLSIPNIASDTINIRRNAESLAQMMQQRGIQKVQLLQADEPTAPPVVYGEVMSPGGKTYHCILRTL